MKALFCALFFLCASLRAEEAWIETLKGTPCPTNAIRVHLTEPVELILTSFRPEGDFRGVVLCPSASDDLYFFDWGAVKLEGTNPTLWDALQAITAKARLKLTFAAPFLLIHAERDKLAEPIVVGKEANIEKLAAKIPGRTYYLDRPWDKLHAQMKKLTGRKILPKQTDSESWHYYRLSFVGYELSTLEFLRAVAYGAKTKVTIEKRVIIFKSFI